MLAGQVAVVTGSGGAMGGAIAERLAGAGARIVLNDRVADRVEAHRAAVEAHGVQAVSVTASTSRPEGARAVVAAALDTWGRLDILVNTVGGIKGPVEVPVWEITDDQWDATPPLGRINDPSDIAGAVAYLVSPDARNVSGQLLTVAGGFNPAL